MNFIPFCITFCIILSLFSTFFVYVHGAEDLSIIFDMGDDKVVEKHDNESTTEKDVIGKYRDFKLQNGFIIYQLTNFVLIDSQNYSRRQSFTIQYATSLPANVRVVRRLSETMTVLKTPRNPEVGRAGAEICQLYEIERQDFRYFGQNSSPQFLPKIPPAPSTDEETVYYMSSNYSGHVLINLHETTRQSTLLVCEGRLQARLKIRKCCQADEIFDTRWEVCVPNSHGLSWSPFVYSIGRVNMPIRYDTGDVICGPQFDFKWSGLDESFMVGIPMEVDGHFILPVVPTPVITLTILGEQVVLEQQREYCYDYTVLDTNAELPAGMIKPIKIRQDSVQTVFRFCGPRALHDLYSYRLVNRTLGHLISMGFVSYIVAALQTLTVALLGVTIATFLVLWKSQTVHSWIRFSFTVAQLFRVVLNILRYVTLGQDRRHHYEIFCSMACQYLDSITFYLVPFWLTSLTVDMLSGFWNLFKRVGARDQNSSSKSWKTYGFFFTFSLLGSLLMLVMQVMVYNFLDYGPAVKIQACPKMNEQHHGSAAFYSSEAVLFLLNATLLGVVVWILRKTEVEVNRALALRGGVNVPQIGGSGCDGDGDSFQRPMRSANSSHTKEMRIGLCGSEENDVSHPSEFYAELLNPSNYSCGVVARLLFMLVVQWTIEICRVLVLASKYYVPDPETEYDFQQYFSIVVYFFEVINGSVVFVAFICTETVYKQLTSRMDNLDKECMSFAFLFNQRPTCRSIKFVWLYLENRLVKGISWLIFQNIKFNFNFNSFCFGCKNVQRSSSNSR